ncbi:hypothetical protein, partial [Candidatus Thiosymbion oneisti]|uniref:hypothetical protein n=1 Tax=Candidatus Thiosymbion oneisti TaxID=589554 RepID=UPI001AAD93A3
MRNELQTNRVEKPRITRIFADRFALIRVIRRFPYGSLLTSKIPALLLLVHLWIFRRDARLSHVP